MLALAVIADNGPAVTKFAWETNPFSASRWLNLASLSSRTRHVNSLVVVSVGKEL
jgi:hypothetical protein